MFFCDTSVKTAVSAEYDVLESSIFVIKDQFAPSLSQVIIRVTTIAATDIPISLDWADMIVVIYSDSEK